MLTTLPLELGATLATSSSVTIPLPDDDPEATTTLCQILHLRNGRIPGKPKTAHILEVAKLVDKYDCAEAVKPTAQCWMIEHLDTSDATALQMLLMSAYYFQHADCFKQACIELVLKSKGPMKLPTCGFMEDCPTNLMKVLCK